MFSPLLLDGGKFFLHRLSNKNKKNAENCESTKNSTHMLSKEFIESNLISQELL